MTTTPSQSILKSFPKVFWVANIMELFERAAYYGMNSVLAIYLTNSIAQGGLGFSEQSVGFLQSIIYALVYVAPILGGALADRYGYRRMLMVAFSLLAIGYYSTGNMSTYGTVFVSLLLLATGAGLFKPIISGTIARTTTEQNSGFGFGIFYWMINLGAFLAPLVVSYLKGFSWSYVFIASSLYCLIMLIPTVFIYRDPPRKNNKKTFKEVLAGAALVLGDSRFMLMLILYSGFWILYFQNFGSVLWFLRDFIDKTPINTFFSSLGIPITFDVEHVTVLNAGTIILLQVVVSKVVQKIKPLPTMITGMIIGSAGFLCLAYANTVWIFIAGIVIFSIGEMTAHPKYLSYVGLIAPVDKKAVYMGYASLYGVIGSLIGSNLGGMLYEAKLKPLIGKTGIEGNIHEFWILFAILGIVAVSGLLIYNRFFAVNTPKTNMLARRVMFVIYICLLLTGIAFFYNSISGEAVSYKLMVQSILMILLGGGGLLITIKHKQENAGEMAK